MTTQEVLQQCTVEGNVVKLPGVQLEKDLYNQVKKKLELIGGKWKGGKVMGFVFEQDPTDLLNDVADGDDRNLKKEYQFFPTPKDIAEQMISYLPPLTPNSTVLEPSAGDGALVKSFRAAYPNIPVECFEIMDLNRKKLEKVDGAVLLNKPDFLHAVADDEKHADFEGYDLLNSYDAIIANPPFTKNQDIDHIYAMYKCLKPGGTIVTLASQSWYTGEQKKQLDFKVWLGALDVFPLTLPDKSFVSSGTNITPLLLMIKKPAAIDTVQESSPVFSSPQSEEFKKGAERFVKNRKKQPVRSCRECGCTDDDCSQCIAMTGSPCTWVQEDLCSACVRTELQQYLEYKRNGGTLTSEEWRADGRYDPSLDPNCEPTKMTESVTKVQEIETIVSETVTEPEADHLKEAMVNDEIVIPAEIIDKVKESERQAQMVSPGGMNFFTQLFPLLDGIDLTLRVKRRNGSLSLEVLPQTGGTIRPAVIAGSPEDLDNGFFNAVQVPVQQGKGLKLQMDEFHKSVVKAKEEASKAPTVAKPAEVKADQPAPAKPATPAAKKPVAKQAAPKKEEKPKVSTPSLDFD